MVKQERLHETWTPQQRNDYHKLVKWLEEHGESVAEAKADIDRWASWQGTPTEKAKLRRREIAQRKAREASAKADAERPNRGLN